MFNKIKKAQIKEEEKLAGEFILAYGDLCSKHGFRLIPKMNFKDTAITTHIVAIKITDEKGDTNA